MNYQNTRTQKPKNQHPRIKDIFKSVAEDSHLSPLAEHPVPKPIKEPIKEKEFVHRRFKAGPFWRSIPAFKDVSEKEFLDYRFQNKNSITNKKGLEDFLYSVTDKAFVEDVKQGLAKAPMNMRISPYILSLIDW